MSVQPTYSRRRLRPSPSNYFPMSMVRRIKRALRGGVGARTLLLEAVRLARAAVLRRQERAMLARLAQHEAPPDARLAPEYERLDSTSLINHFRTRGAPKIFSFDEAHVAIGADDARRIIERAETIAHKHRWTLLGFGEIEFGREIDWLREPVSGARWGLDFHSEVQLMRGDGSDVRVLWELNRLGHLVAIAEGFALTRDERLAEEAFAQIESWRAQNPLGRGPNWACAMEAALRAINLLAVFQTLRASTALTQARLRLLLALFDEHGAHIRRNLEFSYVTTSNHYLSDVAGLFWLGVCLPELQAAREWREFGLRELLSEMDKHVLPDGAHDEASTGYHRFATELFLYSFILARENNLVWSERRQSKLRAMIDYVRAYLRPDGRAPLIGDADGGRLLALAERAADDHAYLLGIGAAVFQEPSFKASDTPPEELAWIFGARAVDAYQNLESAPQAASAAFAHAGVYVMREGDLYLLLSASGAGLGARGSHAHNDSLSIEVSACGESLIADAGTFVYTSNLKERHLFRSTARHSTVQVDDVEQNTTDEQTPFVIGDEAHPRASLWQTAEAQDAVVAEHKGYARLREPVTHRRSVLFDKLHRLWIVTDELWGTGEHLFRFRFHAAPGASAHACKDDGAFEIVGARRAARLFIVPLEKRASEFSIEESWSSRGYGDKQSSQIVCWTLRARTPVVMSWALVPVCAGQDAAGRLESLTSILAKREREDVSGA